MLKNLLKYEFKATSRGIIPLYSALLILALILRIFVVNNIDIDPGIILNFIKILSCFLYGATMAATGVATLLIIVQRFYKNLLGDEGYLMHTLPVSINKNIISKLLVSIVWCCISIIIAIISIFIVALTKDMVLIEFPQLLFQCIHESFSEYGFNVILLIIEIIATILIQIALNVQLLYTAMSIGHLLPKIKTLGSFAAYLGLIAAMSIVMTSAAKIFFSINYFHILFNKFMEIISPITLAHTFFIMAFSINLIWFVIFYILTHCILKYNLNLE